jgi:hypothetical protein
MGLRWQTSQREDIFLHLHILVLQKGIQDIFQRPSFAPAPGPCQATDSRFLLTRGEQQWYIIPNMRHIAPDAIVRVLRWLSRDDGQHQAKAPKAPG